MTINKICVIAGSERTTTTLITQMENTLPGVAVRGLAVDKESEETIKKEVDMILPALELFVISSEQLEQELKEKGLLRKEHFAYVCQRSVNLEEIDKVVYIKPGSNVMFVNDSRESTEECVNALLEFGMDHVGYVTWYPEVEETKQHKSCSIALTAGENQIVPSYVDTIIDLGPRVIAITSLLKIGELLERKESESRRITNYYFSKIISITKQMAALSSETAKIKNILKEKLIVKGHLATYTFSDIRGESAAIEETKERGRRLAKTDLTILIEGESGTGKELLASAIHNESLRRDGPFLAVNFSALPEELAESELFGYEEGAFTGAKKGGKIGLFEQAEGGTIFFDEIGDISQQMQTKLLRVLQEKEIMPLGGGNIKRINVRIVAATNKNLKKMVEQNAFRGDLYYRIKIGYLYMPPLRSRKGDVRILANYFVACEENGKVKLQEELIRMLEGYEWYGNVRELSNLIKYMLAVRNREDVLLLDDIPDEKFFESGEKPMVNEELDPEQAQVLRCLTDIKRKGLSAGRKIITEELLKQGYYITENRVRKILHRLEERGCVRISKGRQGTIVTLKGQQCLKAQSDGMMGSGEKW